MSDKRSKKNTTKNNKNNKASKNRKIPTLRLDNDPEIPAKTTYIKDTECFEINDIDINKIRVSNKNLYNKEHNPYKYYVFYEHDDEYISLKIILKDVVDYYNDYKDNGKTMNFKLDDNSLDKIIDIFGHIEDKLRIDLNNFTYEGKGEECLKTKVSDETCFRKDKDIKTNIIPDENTKYKCRVILKIQSVYYNMKDIRYYPQILIEQCVYEVFSNNKLIHQKLVFTDSEPDFEPDTDESEEEFNENTV